MHESMLIRVTNTVTQIDKQLRQAALCRGIITQHGRECSVAEGFGEALAESFTSACIVGESGGKKK